jgi:hypothetical protein
MYGLSSGIAVISFGKAKLFFQTCHGFSGLGEELLRVFAHAFGDGRRDEVCATFELQVVHGLVFVPAFAGFESLDGFVAEGTLW